MHTLWAALNLGALFHVVELRSARQGHASYRRIAHGRYRARQAHAWLKDLVGVDFSDYARA